MTDFTFIPVTEAPPSVTQSRGYVRYAEQVQATKDHPDQFLVLHSEPIVAAEGKDEAESERLARRRASNKEGMVRAAKGAFSGSLWETRIVRSGEEFQVLVRYAGPAPVLKAESGNGTTGNGEGTENGAQASAEGTVTAEGVTDPAASTAEGEAAADTSLQSPEGAPRPRGRRG